MKASLLFLTGLVTAWGQSSMEEVRIRTVQVSDRIYMLQGRGGNIGLCTGPDGAFLVDDQFAPLSEKIQKTIAGVTAKPVRFLVNTHWHGDHTGGNENFGKSGALIVAHQNVRKRLNPAELREQLARSQQAPAAALPVVTFTDALNFYWNHEEIHVFHLPTAHTDGDAVIHFTKANVVHMGDLFFNGRYPFIDVESGGSIQGAIGAAEKILTLANSSTKIIPGHGDLAGVKELRSYRDMLVKVRDRVQGLINDGHSEEEILAARPTADLDTQWGERSDRFVRAVDRSLRAARE